jgi:hypothetical protein
MASAGPLGQDEAFHLVYQEGGGVLCSWRLNARHLAKFPCGRRAGAASRWTPLARHSDRGRRLGDMAAQAARQALGQERGRQGHRIQPQSVERSHPFLDDGRLCMSNDAAERALRCVAVGRHNWTFAGSDEGGRRAAAVYTLIETALCRGRHKAGYTARRTMVVCARLQPVERSLAQFHSA